VIADSLVAKSHKVTCLAKEICVVLVLYGSLFFSKHLCSCTFALNMRDSVSFSQIIYAYSAVMSDQF
jgi:hypothetical protein